jgi:hypothetical protein
LDHAWPGIRVLNKQQKQKKKQREGKYGFSDDMRDPTPILETNDDDNLWYGPTPFVSAPIDKYEARNTKLTPRDPTLILETNDDGILWYLL